jgi:hypothetical protein
MKTAAILALGGGFLLVLAWLVGLGMMAGRGAPARGNVLVATGISWIHLFGGIGCILAFGWLWFEELSACATGAREDLDMWVVLWSTVLALVGMAAVWMVLVRRVWCTPAGLVRRTWRGKVQQVPYRKLAGAAQFRFDDVILPCEEEKVVLDVTQPDFWRVMDHLAKQGVDFSAIPPHLDQRLDKKRARHKNRT